MRAFPNKQNLCNDKWLSALVDAMEEAEALRADDVCRGADVPARLMTQLRGRRSSVEPVQRGTGPKQPA